MAKLPGFVGPSYESQSLIVAGERTINFYPALIESEFAKARSALWPCPGMTDFASPTDSPGRGIFGENDRLFAVFGTTLYESTSAGALTNRGPVATDANPATFTTNGDGGSELFITSGDEGYILDLATNVLTNEVSNVTMGGQVDGFFVALDAASSTLKISESLDGKTWDASQIAQRTAASDPWKAMLVSRREIFLFGEKTGEVWYNKGSSPFPFAQRPGAFFEIGIAAPNSLTPFGTGMAWLGRSARGSGIVYAMNGYSPSRISNEAIEWTIQTYKDAVGISDAIGWSYEQLGHVFYVLEFPTSGKTWVYDGAVNQWHERGKWNTATSQFDPYRPRFHAEMWDKNLVCDSAAGKIYQLDPTVYTDVGGSILRRVRRCPHLSAEHKQVFYDYFEVECQRGIGLTTGQGSDPQLMLNVSDDGGQTWTDDGSESLGSNPIGATGEYSTRVRWDRLGMGRDRVFEVAVTDPVKVCLFDAYVGARVGAH